MKYSPIWLIALFSFCTLEAAIIGPAQNSKFQASGKSQIILDALWEELNWPENKTPSPSKKEQKKPLKKITKKEVPPTPDPIPSPTPMPTPRKLSKGENKVQEMLRKNRERLKRLREQQKYEKQPSKKAEVSPFKKVDLSKDIHTLRNEGLRNLKRRQKETLSSWKEKVQETYKYWKEKRKEFLKELPQYKENLITFESEAQATPNNKLKRPIKTPVRSEYHLIPGAFDVPMRNQGRRPTCSAFAGIRAIETLLYGNNLELDLSEQYFYWSSKPKCRQFPCNQRGSWVRSGYDYSKKAPSPDIPLESQCPYVKRSKNGNETQVPLGGGCYSGKVKVTNYESLDTLDELVGALNRNLPIIGGFKLSPNFYKTQGLITYKESLVQGKVDSHAAGHALLLVGHMKLPPQLAKVEGKVCFITANSWGEGWGKGGFGCLTERWMRHYRIKNAFVAIKNARVE